MKSNLICPQNSNIFSALRKINANAKGAVFVTDCKRKLLGVVTDGDIRRALLSGKKLEDKVISIVNRKFVFASKKDTYNRLLKKISKKITIIPIVDDNFRVIDFFKYERNYHIPMITPNLKGNEFNYLSDAFLSTWISSTGEYINRFEKAFADFVGCKYALAVSSGTVALHLALVALGIKKGDEVIIPDLTFAATINAVLYTGATPVIVDIDKISWCIDSLQIKKAITNKTKAIIPVHLYGQPCEMDKIVQLAKKYNLHIVEDCAEAHGAEFDNKKVGSIGSIGCFSFYGNKIITTGEGGMCVTNSQDIYDKMRILKNHGMSENKKYWHDVVGFNYRMTNLQAAIGLAQVERINQILFERNKIEKQYRKYLANDDDIEMQKNNLPKRQKITWLVSALIKNNKRDDYMVRLKKAGIDVRPFFYPLSSMKIYKKYSSRLCVNSKLISQKGINFPTEPYLYPKYFTKIKHILDKSI